MAQDGVSKAVLLEGLKAGRDNLLTSLRGIRDEEFERGLYENGWNGRQILAHVAGIEWTYPRLIDVARGDEPPKKEKSSEPAERSKVAQGGINSYNDRTVERYAGTSVKELLAIFEENRAKTIAAIEAADDGLFQVHVRSAGGIPGPLGTVLNYVAVVHVAGHVNDIVAAKGD
ncbi:MAG: DinB family protein [Dehalococcoidia bacterium]